MSTTPVLVFNCGSSSLSYKVFGISAEPGGTLKIVTIASGKAHRVGTKSTEKPFLEHRISATGAQSKEERNEIPSHAVAASAIIDFLDSRGIAIGLVGHRFVHGGDLFDRSVLVTGDVRARLASCVPLAPIHNPVSLAVIDVCESRLVSSRGIRQFVAFDTAFHRAMPAESFTYAIPSDLARERGFRKFGFHGLSYSFVVDALATHGITGGPSSRVVACHIGTGGASVAAIRGGQSVDTTMGWSPLPGLVMSTRCGDIDASIALALVDKDRTTADVVRLLNNQSGLVGLTGGVTSDLRDAYAISLQPSHKNYAICKLAFDVYCHRLIGAIGSLVAILGGIDVLAFTDDLGFNMPPLRGVVCSRLEFLGLAIDPELNAKATKGNGPLFSSDTCEIHTPSSKVRVAVVVNDEESVIAREAKPFL